MFDVGDRVVYPMYGAGVIEEIKDEKFNGKTEKFFVLHICLGELKLLISVDNVDKIGLRTIAEADKVMDIIMNTQPISMPSNWIRRYEENTARLKTGDLQDAMQVYKTLILRERIKSLSNKEKKMLGSAKKFILSEIILSQNVCKEDAEQILLSSVSA